MSVLRNKVNKILLAIKNGDEKSKSILFEETYNHLKYIAYKYISDKNYIEDIIVNSYIKIFASIKHFDSGKDGYNRLCKTVQNEAYTFNRKNKITVSIDEQPNVSDSADFSEYVVEKDELERLLSEYEPRDREIIRLKFWEDCSYNEIAKILGMKKSNVHKRASKILKEIRDKLKEK